MTYSCIQLTKSWPYLRTLSILGSREETEQQKSVKHVILSRLGAEVLSETEKAEPLNSEKVVGGKGKHKNYSHTIQ